MIQNNMTYIPKVYEINNEEEIIELINDISSNLSLLENHSKKFSPKQILDIIGKREYEIPRENFTDSIDLSKAWALVHQYGYSSEGGCRSCQMYGGVKPLPDETIFYCKIDDNEENAIKRFAKDISETSSLKIKKYSKSGCENKKPIFRPLEEVLKELG